MKIAGAVGLVAAFALLGPACGGGDQPRQATQPDRGSEVVRVNDLPVELPDLARGLIPPEALESEDGEFAVEECGIQPVFPCVRAYFVTEGLELDARLALVRRQARSAGWRIVSEQRDPGVIVEVQRGDYFGSYVLEREGLLPCKEAARCMAGTMLTVAAPPTPLPAPSDAERARWSAEKHAFVEDANAICREMQTRMIDPDEIAAALSHGLKNLSALKPPAGEEDEIHRILRPLRNLARAADALTDDQGEDALPAAVGVGLFARRFNEAASRYGLETCAALG